MTPFPIPLTTPPETRIYLVIAVEDKQALEYAFTDTDKILELLLSYLPTWPTRLQAGLDSFTYMDEPVNNYTPLLVTSVYRDVWEEFCAWNRKYSTAAIQSLRRNVDTEGDDDDDESEPAHLCSPQDYTSDWLISPDSLEWEWPEENVIRRSDSTEDMMNWQVAVMKAPKMEPFPPYESCAPINTCTFVGDDPIAMPFVPFPDDDFDFDEYYHYYDEFAWEEENRNLDPDTEMIVLEAIRRLDNYHDVPLEEIKRILIPNFSISSLGQRVLLQWLPFPIQHSDIPRSLSLPALSGIRSRFDGIAKCFCPNLNCIGTFCALHEKYPLIGPQEGTPLGDKSNRIVKPCGSACFLLSEGSSLGNNRDNETARNMIIATLAVFPGMSTCQLAVSCGLTCCEAHKIRRSLASPSDNDPHNSSPKSASTDSIVEQRKLLTKLPWAMNRKSRLFSDNESNRKINLFQVTDHVIMRVLATARLIVLAISTELTAKRVAAALRNVERDSAVVNAVYEGMINTPVGAIIVFAFALVENAILRSVFHAKKEVSRRQLCSHLRTNSQISLTTQQKTIVKRSKYGMGLFVDEPVRKHELILEYTGEYIFESTANSRGCLATFRGRSYLYNLVGPFSIDASRAGNESRFINHDDERGVNCEAKYQNVNGVIRIGIYATKRIKRGTELRMDYGDDFFKDN
ncbi:SET-domain-containing protein [Fomitiporia mediterranea MF3/22]|uniref:SET-domain-containing protein n=1 Tax=Fomitiporia mediterranea (strain MF3/22) TaxID=694068 RepID=UPI0004408625|nr:SET-domain-containing protein [Fomitiporia mediterranea MF3/22]EJD05501.1 SET-domain-containing protein [Fomitiporia mediterranea MF3/22]